MSSLNLRATVAWFGSGLPVEDAQVVCDGGVITYAGPATPIGDAAELPSFNGPLIRAAGPMLTGHGGYPTTDRWAPAGKGVELQGPEHAERVVSELATRGATAVKVSLNAEAG